jgi:hypothetical protein
MKTKKIKCNPFFYVLILTILFGAIQALTLKKVVETYKVAERIEKAQIQPPVALQATPSVVVKEVKLTTNNPDVELQIRAIADELNFKWPDYLVRLAKCESSMNPKAVSNPNKNGSVDRGLFQWNSKMPPLSGVDEKCALDVDCSTRKTIEAINLGKQHHWMCNKIVLNK